MRKFLPCLSFKFRKKYLQGRTTVYRLTINRKRSLLRVIHGRAMEHSNNRSRYVKLTKHMRCPHLKGNNDICGRYVRKHMPYGITFPYIIKYFASAFPSNLCQPIAKQISPGRLINKRKSRLPISINKSHCWIKKIPRSSFFRFAAYCGDIKSPSNQCVSHRSKNFLRTTTGINNRPSIYQNNMRSFFYQTRIFTHQYSPQFLLL